VDPQPNQRVVERSVGRSKGLFQFVEYQTGLGLSINVGTYGSGSYANAIQQTSGRPLRCGFEHTKAKFCLAAVNRGADPR